MTNQKPKCKTCGGSGWVDIDGQSGKEMEEVGNEPLEHLPCPRCQPKGELVKMKSKWQDFEGGILDSALSDVYRLAARIGELEKERDNYKDAYGLLKLSVSQHIDIVNTEIEQSKKERAALGEGAKE